MSTTLYKLLFYSILVFIRKSTFFNVSNFTVYSHFIPKLLSQSFSHKVRDDDNLQSNHRFEIKIEPMYVGEIQQCSYFTQTIFLFWG